jgi:hypothetical protein
MNVIDNLNTQAHIGFEMNNANGKLLMRIANMCSWMEKNDLNIYIKPLVGDGEKRKCRLEYEMRLRILKY